MTVTINWEVPPSELARAIARYGDKVQDAIEEMAKDLARQANFDMKAQRPWQDRTGEARERLASEVERASKDVVILYLIHGADHGVYLEYMQGGRFAIIQPTMQRMYSFQREV